MFKKIKNWWKTLKVVKKVVEKESTFNITTGEKAITEFHVPVIYVEKYPEMAIRGVELTRVVADKLSKKYKVKPEVILENIDFSNILDYIVIILTEASEQFFEYVAFMTFEGQLERWQLAKEEQKEQIQKVKTLGLADLLRVVRKIFEVNEYTEVAADPLFSKLKNLLRD